MNLSGTLTLLLIVFFIINACTPITPTTVPVPETVNTGAEDAADVELNDDTVKTMLQEQYNQWKGTPYKAGGLSTNGIDCSGLVYLIFGSMGITVPRTTALQVTTGVETEPKDMRPGDLVFFKTGIFSRHVGIYLEDALFLHASTRRGVILSSLHEKYWNDHYWVTRRINLSHD